MMKVFVVVVLCLMVQLSLADDGCPPDACKNVKPVLSCKAGRIIGGGYCGCTDLCTLDEGEQCDLVAKAGSVPCTLSLQCVQRANLPAGKGVCGKRHPDVDLGYRPHRKRASGHARTRCEQMRMSSLISMVVYEGQWIAKCDSDGNFMPMQCDNTRHCFCVDTLTGQVLEGTKVLGTAHCS